MGISVKNGVPSFFHKLKAVEKDLPQFYADKVAEEGRDYAQSLYGDGATNVFILSGEKGESKIIAEGVGLLYREYGTGEQGRSSGYPKDKQQVVHTFRSQPLGRTVTLKEWTYSYAHELDPTKPAFMHGQEAGMQMLNTSLELRRKYAKNIKE